MAEQELQIYTNGEYKNVFLKTKTDKKTGEVKQGLTLGNHVILEKGEFAEAYVHEAPNYTSYKLEFIYKGELVAYWTYREDEATDWNDVGGTGDKVKVTAVSIPYKYKGKEQTRLGLSFELVS